MNKEDFSKQVNRMVETYGKQAFPIERVNLLWEQVKPFTVEWFEKSVSLVIGSMRYAPLLSDFNDLCSAERERVRLIEKQKETREIMHVVSGSAFSSTDEKWMFKTIFDRMQNRVNDQDWEKFLQLIQYSNKSGSLEESWKIVKQDG